MNARGATEQQNQTTTERTSDRELVVRRTIIGPAHVVFDAWTRPELLRRWWMPESYGVSFISCDVDARAGGKYRFVFSHPEAPQPMAFYGRYLEVTPYSRLKWTNEEAGDNGQVTTVTFEEKDGKTLVVVHDLYPSKAALDEAIASGSTSGMSEEMFAQLDALLRALDAS